MKKSVSIIFMLFFYLLIQGAFVYGSSPRVQTFSTFSQFQRGTLDNVSILSEGKLTIAPQKQQKIDTGDPFVWDVAIDSKENVYLGTGNDGRVYKISTKGDSTLFFDATELEVYSLAIDNKDNIYVATSPRGKVYKVSPQGDSKVFFDPDDIYIWDILFEKNGNLLVATGEEAKVYRITPGGGSTLIYQSEQKHFRCLAIDGQNNLYAGTGGNGYVYKFLQDNNPFVLFDTQMQEVHSIAISSTGTVYAAAFGEPGARAMDDIARGTEKSSQKTSGNGQSGSTGSGDVSLSPQSFIPEGMSRLSKVQTSLFSIDKDGYARDVWDADDDYIQSLTMDDKDMLWIGTGNHGNLYKMSQDNEFSLVLDSDESQITNLYISENNKIFMCTSNMGRCYQINFNSAMDAHFESETIDSGSQSRWGVLSWQGTFASDHVQFFTRSGNTERTEKTWSPWQQVKRAENNILQIISPSARFIQWKCEMKGDLSQKRYIKEVSISYLQKNLPPSISAVVIHKPGDYYDTKASMGINVTNPSQGEAGLVYPMPLPKSEFKKGFRSVDWMFEDPNFDGLIFDVFYKKTGQNKWKDLATNLKNNYISWDSSQMSDGEYQIKVVATDSPGNPAALCLKAEKVSNSFVIDNSPPTITHLKQKNISNEILQGFTISDEFSKVSKVFYSIDVDGWKSLYPIDQINDSKVEKFEIQIPKEKLPAELSIKAFDINENVIISQKTITGS